MSTDPRNQLEHAREAIAAERERSLEEQAAFRAFLDRVEELDTAPAGIDTDPTETPQALRVPERATGARTDEVWTAYCETVLDVSHFEDYGETPLEHLRAELGDDVVALLTEKQPLTGYHEEVITSRVASSIELRDEQLTKMDAETEMVDRAADLLRAARTALADRETERLLELSPTQLADAETELHTLLERCDELLAERQELLDSRPEVKRFDRESTVGYLYRDLDVTYPVIAAVTSVRERLESRQSDIEAVRANSSFTGD